MSLVSGEKSNFQFILRLLNTNVRLYSQGEKNGDEISAEDSEG
jgi:hypothetical protein